MRSDLPHFNQVNRSLSKEPRHVIAILFDVGSVYCTSHGDIPNVPGVVLNGVVQRPNVLTQRIVPDEGRSEMAAANFRLVDVGSSFTTEMRSKLAAGKGLRGRFVKFYRGFKDFDFTEFQLLSTQVVSEAEFADNAYLVSCRGITREQRNKIFDLAVTTLTADVSATATTVPVNDATKFTRVFHGTSYTDSPSSTVGYIKIKDEVIRYTGSTSTSFTGCTRGVFGTKAAAYAVDAATQQDRREQVTEYVYLELPVPKLIYALCTGVLYNDSANLPTTWHLGMSTTLIRLLDFQAIGDDLWTSGFVAAANDNAGLVARFEGLSSTDGKSFIEQELLTMIGCYSPEYADGTLGLKRMTRILRDASPVLTLNESNSVQVGELVHDMQSMHNNFQINWNFNGDRFTRRNILLDSASIAIHGKAPVYERSYKGLHGSRHTDGFILKSLDMTRDRYAAPPERMKVRLLHGLNAVEVGDPVRVNYASVRDFAGAAGPINRVFEVQHASDDGENLDVELFGSTTSPSIVSPTTPTTALPDAFYTSNGAALSTVATISGNTVQPGAYTVTGNNSLIGSGAIYYHNADLTIANGATLNLGHNVQLRVKGFLQINGVINGKGTGNPGGVDPGTNTQVGSAPNGTADPLIFAALTGGAVQGYVGSSRGMDGVQVRNLFRGSSTHTYPAALLASKFATAPILSLTVSGNNLLGLPGDLQGAGGPPGGRAVATGTSGTGTLDQFNGGSGANGGAGLCIICRGMAFGASGSINLDGNDAAATSVQSLTAPGGMQAYPGAGGAGGPGTLYVLLDGGSLSVPTIGLNNFSAKSGSVPINGFPLPKRNFNGPINLIIQPVAGYQDESMISALDLFNACQRVQYIPANETVQSDQPSKPPAPTGLSIVSGYGFNAVRLTLPGFETFDVAEVWSSLDNQRANATLVGEGRKAEFKHELPPNVTRYYWARTRNPGFGNIPVWSDWLPSGATSGIAATTLATPKGVFFESWDHQSWESLYNDRANGGGLTVTYPTSGDNSGRVIQAAGAELWIARKENIPFDPNALYRIEARVRRTASGGGTGFEYCYVGVEGVAANGVDLINSSGANSSSSQHYNCFPGTDLSLVGLNTWVTAVGYFRGNGTGAGIGGASADPNAPTPLYTGVRYFRPLIILNYNAGNGTQQCDYIQVDEVVETDGIVPNAVTDVHVTSEPADGSQAYTSGTQPRVEVSGLNGSATYTSPASTATQVTVGWSCQAQISNTTSGVAVGEARLELTVTINGSLVFTKRATLEANTGASWAILSGSRSFDVPAGQAIVAALKVYRNFTTGGASPAQTIFWRDALIDLLAAKR